MLKCLRLRLFSSRAIYEQKVDLKMRKLDYELFKMFATIAGISIFLTTITAVVILKYIDFTNFYKDEANAMLDSYLTCVKANPNGEASCREKAIEPYLVKKTKEY